MRSVKLIFVKNGLFVPQFWRYGKFLGVFLEQRKKIYKKSWTWTGSDDNV
jgi:hypothetical protein